MAAAGEGRRRTSGVGAVIPLPGTLPDIAGRTVIADARLTRRALAGHLLDRGAGCLFAVRGKQPNPHDDIRLLSDEGSARAPDFIDEGAGPEHGRRERRSIRVSGALDDRPDVPGVGQVFALRRETVEVRSGRRRCGTACGVTSLAPQAATPECLPLSTRPAARRAPARTPGPSRIPDRMSGPAPSSPTGAATAPEIINSPEDAAP